MIVPKTLDQISTYYRKGVIYSGPGFGKTLFAVGSLLRNTFVFDVDQGIDTVFAHRVKYGLPIHNVKFHPIKSMQDMRDGWMWLNANMNWIQGGIVVIDSATELQRIDMRESLKAKNKKYPELREWGMILTDMEDLFADSRTQPFDMVITAHEYNREDKDLRRDVWRPSFQGRFANEYAKHLSFIGRLMLGYHPPYVDQAGQVQQQIWRAVNFGPDPSIHYKDRSGMLGQFEQPDIDMLFYKMSMFNYLNGGHSNV